MSRIAFANKVSGQPMADRLAREWACVYRPLRIALYDLAEQAFKQCGIKALTLTCIHRTPEENAALPNSNADSLHMIFPGTRAADIRIWGMAQMDMDNLRHYWANVNPVGFDLIQEGTHLHAEVDERFHDEEAFVAARDGESA